MTANETLTLTSLSYEYDKFPKRAKTASDDDITVIDIEKFRQHILDNYEVHPDLDHPLMKFINKDTQAIISYMLTTAQDLIPDGQRYKYFSKYRWIIDKIGAMVQYFVSNFPIWIAEWKHCIDNNKKIKNVNLPRRIWLYIKIFDMFEDNSKYQTKFLDLLLKYSKTEYTAICVMLLTVPKYLVRKDRNTCSYFIMEFSDYNGLMDVIFKHLITNTDPEILSFVLKVYKPDLARLIPACGIILTDSITTESRNKTVMVEYENNKTVFIKYQRNKSSNNCLIS